MYKKERAGRKIDQLHFSSPDGDRTCKLVMKFQIICDSAADLPAEYTQEQNVTVVPFYVSMDSENYLREGVDISIPDFYQTMVDHKDCFPKTSMPSIQDYMDAFLPFVEAKMPVLCICLTKKFSGSYQSAVNAKMEIEEEHKDAVIEVIDSELVTALEGLFVQEAIRLRDMDLELQDAVSKLKEIRSTGQIFFTTDDLKYLEHGGRLGKVSSIAGTMLNLKPILHFEKGELDHTEVCRGRKRSVQKVVDQFFKYIEENQIDLSKYWYGTGIGLDVDDYDHFKELLDQGMEKRNIKPASRIQIRIGATIGVHTGPYPMGLGILKKCDI